MGFGFGFQQKSVAQQGWNRPSEWLPISNLIDLNNEQKAVMLYHIRDDIDYDSIAFTVEAETANTITIDWGDGTVDTDLANGKHVHDYDFASINSQLTAEGYKQGIVTVTASSNITRLYFAFQTNSQGEYSVGFMDGVFSMPYLTTAKQMFREMVTTKSIVIGDMNNATTMEIMAYRCYSLENFIVGNAVNCEDIHALVSGCHSLKKVTIPRTKTTTTRYVIDGCYRLEEVYMGEYTEATDNNRNFSNNISMTKIVLEKYNNDINIKGSALSTTRIIELFNNLETVTDKTITITGVRGASGLSDADKAIATDKGWTLVV